MIRERLHQLGLAIQYASQGQTSKMRYCLERMRYGWVRGEQKGNKFVWKGTDADKGKRRVQIIEPGTRAKGKKPAAERPSLEQVRTDLDALKGSLSKGDIEQVAEKLMSLHIRDLRALKDELGTKTSPWKANLAKNLAREIIKRAKGESPDDSEGKPGGTAVRAKPAKDGGGVAKETGGPNTEGANQGGQGAGQPPGAETARRVPASIREVNFRLDRLENFFRGRDQHHVGDWIELLRQHIGEVGPRAALESLLEDRGSGSKEPIQYYGVNVESEYWDSMDHFVEQYLNRNGIVPITEGPLDPNSPLLSSQTNRDVWIEQTRDYAGADFRPSETPYNTKLDEAKDLLGLESSEDINVITGQKVTHLTPEVMAAMDEKYGKDGWIIKAYGDEAAAGYGIFFPQRARQLQQDAQSAVWTSGQELARFGFEHLREKPSGGVSEALGKFGGLELPVSDPNERWRHPPKVQERYNARILETARQRGLMADPKVFARATQSPNVGGLEHDVHEDKESGRFFKFTKGGHFGQSKDLPDYLERQAIANQMWPELNIQFHGITQDHEGQPQAVVSMSRINGGQPDQEKIHLWFQAHGWEPHGGRFRGQGGEDLGQRDWIDPRTGTIIRDAHSGNFREQENGALVPIDVDILPGPKAKEEISRQDEHPHIVGIRHQDGSEYRFGTDRYEQQIQGEARQYADAAQDATEDEFGASLPDEGKDFMAQPAFPVIGVSEQERAEGKTIAKGEGRVHLVTRNGKAEIIPHSTWLKGESLPVVFETEDTRAMAKAAQEAIDRLPEKARAGQIYSPDIVKTKDGYRVIELNASVEYGGSGYLSDNPFIIDAYTSHMAGRDPAHVRFIRKLLISRTKERQGQTEKAQRYQRRAMKYMYQGKRLLARACLYQAHSLLEK